MNSSVTRDLMAPDTEQGLAHEWFQGCEYINQKGRIVKSYQSAPSWMLPVIETLKN